MIKALPGFRDFYPEDAARRAEIFDRWRRTASVFGFQEMDSPVLEPLELYRKKSGDELVGQLFSFEDKGGREVALRPEMTPTLVRMVAARERDFRKPIKWFSIANFFRFERPQRGRLREFAQLNCDLVGASGPVADAELVTLLVETLRSCDLTHEDFAVRISDRGPWVAFAAERGLDEEGVAGFLGVLDKMERMQQAEFEARLAPLGVAAADVRAFAADGASGRLFEELRGELAARGVMEFVEFDLRIVRGLAYYTGLVFEAFDRRGALRAIAGGGRYDDLLKRMSDGAVDLPAAGFGLGDVVVFELLQSLPDVWANIGSAAARRRAVDVYVVVASEDMRTRALSATTMLRRAGVRTDMGFDNARVGKQFQAAEQAGAQFAVVYGNEWPRVKIKRLVTREERTIPEEDLLAEICAAKG